MNAKLFVANLDWNVTESELTDLFSEVGSVVSARIPTRREDGKPRGFAFVEMSSAEEALSAINAYHESDLRGRPIVVKYQEEQAARAPRGDYQGNRSGGGDRY
ncbi:MAG: RNA-binding protein [Cyanobacteria bacterium]|nr:RNA-binding protein [Cyanobacteriota bacterium]